jgi:hypothetical protein
MDGPAQRRLRRLSTSLCPAHEEAPATISCVTSSGGFTLALISHEGGPHFEAYLDAAAAVVARDGAASRVVLCDMDGTWLQKARAVLGTKLAKIYSDPHELLAAEKPLMSLVAMEAVLGPPVIRAALEAGSHVMAEKPSCTNPDDLRELTALADSKGLYIMMALSNRLNGETTKAKALFDSGAIGELFGMELHQVADQTRLGRPGASETWSNIKARSGGTTHILHREWVYTVTHAVHIYPPLQHRLCTSEFQWQFSGNPGVNMSERRGVCDHD